MQIPNASRSIDSQLASQPATSTMASGGGGGDRLSDLPDDLLRHILHFAPAKEAASTCALSRRLRSLWHTSAAINLEVRVLEGAGPYDFRGSSDYYARLFSQRDAFISAAKAALAAAADPVTRLTLRVEAERQDTIYDFLSLLRRDFRERWPSVDLVADVLSHPAARRVEELRLAAVDYFRMPLDHGIYELSLGSLPSETLRVLDLTSCSISAPPPAAVEFPRLASLRLRFCFVPLDHLQGIIDAAPALAIVHLESVYFEPQKEGVVVRLRCLAAKTLVLDKCCRWTQWGDVDLALEIDAPRLRRFRYKGLLRPLSLCTPAPDMARLDLHFIPRNRDKDPRRDRAIFWKLLDNFRNAKELKLVVHHLEDIAVVGAAERAELLRCAFGGLERLELEGVHRPKGKTAGVAIANLLRCCPVVRDLRINLSTPQGDSDENAQYGRKFLRSRFRDDLHKSIDHFMRRRLERMVPLEGEGDDDDDDDDDVNYDEVSDIPALSGRSFECLQNSLRYVGLQFRPENSNCFGIKLIKFFAENAMSLEEMRIDGGNGRVQEHMNRKVEKWIANSSKRRNLRGTTSLRILPLER